MTKIIAALGIVCLLLCAGVWVQSSRLGTAQDKIALLESQTQTLSEDVTRWKNAGVGQTSIIADQRAEIARLRSDAAKAQQTADAAEADRLRQAAEINSFNAELKRKAHEKPDQVRPLGPLARDALSSMRNAGGAGTPAVAPAGN